MHISESKLVPSEAHVPQNRDAVQQTSEARQVDFKQVRPQPRSAADRGLQAEEEFAHSRAYTDYRDWLYRSSWAAHGAGLGITLEPGVASTVQTSARADIRGKVTAASTLKPNVRSYAMGRTNRRTQMRPACQLSGTLNWTEVYPGDSQLECVREKEARACSAGKDGTFSATIRSVYVYWVSEVCVDACHGA